MATGPDGRELAADASTLSASPEPSHVHIHLEAPPGEIEGVRASPILSRKTLDALGAENESTGGDPENYPLHTPWTFWFDRSLRGATAQDFFANLRSLYTVKTIKAFWSVFNNLKPVDQLNDRESYHLMRSENRRPVWEDENNAHGGLWSFKVFHEDTAMVWQELLLAAVGEQFSECMDEADEVCGISVRVRRFDQNIIQIWNLDSELHSKSSIIQKVKELVPNIEINEYYVSNRTKMRESLSKPFHRGISPPPPSQRRYTGAPHAVHPPFPMPGPRLPGYPPGPHPHHPPLHAHFHPRYRHPLPPRQYLSRPPGPYPAP